MTSKPVILRFKSQKKRLFCDCIRKLYENERKPTDHKMSFFRLSLLQHPHLFPHFGESRNGRVDLLAAVGG